MENSVLEKPTLVFHDDWASSNFPIWQKYCGHLIGKDGVRMLEVGSWEGRSACWFWGNIITGKDCWMVCIDTFKGNPYNSTDSYVRDVEKIFIENLKAIGKYGNTWILKGRSDFMLRQVATPQDIIYIDGSHDYRDVMIDLCLSWGILKHGGVMILDDYEYCMSDDLRPKVAIDAFQKLFRKEIIELHRGWQILWRKT